MKRKDWFLVCCITVLDQAIKAYIRVKPYGDVFFEMPGIFALRSSVNTGAAFSLLSGSVLFLTLLSALLLSVVFLFAYRKTRLTRTARLALACLLGGGCGNLIDRLFFSGVTDYIQLLFIDFPIFNLADMAITGAIGILMILLLTDTLEITTEDKHGSSHRTAG